MSVVALEAVSVCEPCVAWCDVVCCMVRLRAVMEAGCTMVVETY